MKTHYAQRHRSSAPVATWFPLCGGAQGTDVAMTTRQKDVTCKWCKRRLVERRKLDRIYGRLSIRKRRG